LTASCDGCDEIYYGPGLHFNIGWQLTPNLGIFLDGGGLGVDPDTDGQATLVQAVVAVGVQYWIQQPIWLKAGIGSAQLSIYSDFLEDETETVFGLLLAAGYEIVSQPGFSVDAEFRIATGFYDEVDGSSVTNFGVQFSVNWHSLFQPFIVIR